MKLPFWFVLLVCLSPALSSKASSPVVDFLSDHCLDCHSDGESSEAGLDLESVSWDLGDPKSFSLWASVLDRVASGEMPPVSESQPTADQRSEFVTVLKSRLIQHNLDRQIKNGRTVLRRLNRDEYERTVQDLLGITTPLAELLPRETPLGGFDTVAGGLRFSALHMNHYLAAANVALDQAIDLTVEPKWVNERFDYTKQEGILKNIEADKSIVRLLDDAAVMFSDASYINRIHGLNIDRSGMYRIRARARGFQTDRPVTLSLHAGNWNKASTRVLTFADVPPDESSEVEVIARLEHNEYVYPAPKGLNIDEQGHGVWHYGGEAYEAEGIAVEWIEVEGPLVESWPPPSVKNLVGDVPIEKLEHHRWVNPRTIAYELRPDDPKYSLEQTIRRFANRAFRRPVSDDDISIYLEMANAALEEGDSFESSLRMGLRGILTSPRFLTMQENTGKLDDHALACRLSYFLTSTMPDDELRELADEGRLSDPEVLRAQTQRLMDDPRSDVFVQRFTDQWLDLQRIDATSPDKMLYPEFTDLLQLCMVGETRAFFRELLQHDLSVLNFVDSDFAMLNKIIAGHYEIDGVEGQDFVRTRLPDGSLRGGVLTQASVLKVTANGTVTSPVARGAFVLTRLLNSPPSPPPPGVGSIEPDTRGATTVREQLAKHSVDMTCARCHAAIDPPGFALENFDVIGGYRERYRSTGDGERVTDKKLNGRMIWQYKYGLPVDSGGTTSDGTEFRDVKEFKEWLLSDPDRIASAIAAQLLTYATGTPIELADRERVDEIVARSRDSQFGLRTIVHEIVQSKIFQTK
ncbi:Planctomycete cytochrome C [Rubripirellula amarantea]|uniref:Planctomycete cytochrome C n=1 Tax=Rubripirellula amarantea TaxID=2527999 RepID=A0A5C5WTT7_9BACT|nr:DUF1592 domain-containing protein [Rubripirellula amarantea]TWT53978.1 Planctomycete cytochrome C [Rubripirellula amarantea]